MLNLKKNMKTANITVLVVSVVCGVILIAGMWWLIKPKKAPSGAPLIYRQSFSNNDISTKSFPAGVSREAYLEWIQKHLFNSLAVKQLFLGATSK